MLAAWALGLYAGVVGSYACYHSELHIPILFSIGKLTSFLFFPGENALRNYQFTFALDASDSTGSRRPCSLCDDAPHLTEPQPTAWTGAKGVKCDDRLNYLSFAGAGAAATWYYACEKYRPKGLNGTGIYIDKAKCIPIKGMYGFDRVGANAKDYVKARMAEETAFGGGTPYAAPRATSSPYAGGAHEANLTYYYRQHHLGEGLPAQGVGQPFVPPAQADMLTGQCLKSEAQVRGKQITFHFIPEQFGLATLLKDGPYQGTPEMTKWGGMGDVLRKGMPAYLLSIGYPAFNLMKIDETNYLCSLEYTPSITVTRQTTTPNGGMFSPLRFSYRGVSNWTEAESKAYIAQFMTCNDFMKVQAQQPKQKKVSALHWE